MFCMINIILCVSVFDCIKQYAARITNDIFAEYNNCVNISFINTFANSKNFNAFGIAMKTNSIYVRKRGKDMKTHSKLSYKSLYNNFKYSL